MKKRVTVTFSHEVNGRRSTGQVDFVLEANTRTGYGPGAFANVICQKLEEAGIAKPEVTDIDMRFGEPPMMSL